MKLSIRDHVLPQLAAERATLLSAFPPEQAGVIDSVIAEFTQKFQNESLDDYRKILALCPQVDAMDSLKAITDPKLREAIGKVRGKIFRQLSRLAVQPEPEKPAEQQIEKHFRKAAETSEKLAVIGKDELCRMDSEVIRGMRAAQAPRKKSGETDWQWEQYNKAIDEFGATLTAAGNALPHPVDSLEPVLWYLDFLDRSLQPVIVLCERMFGSGSAPYVQELREDRAQHRSLLLGRLSAGYALPDHPVITEKPASIPRQVLWDMNASLVDRIGVESPTFLISSGSEESRERVHVAIRSMGDVVRALGDGLPDVVESLEPVIAYLQRLDDKADALAATYTADLPDQAAAAIKDLRDVRAKHRSQLLGELRRRYALAEPQLQLEPGWPLTADTLLPWLHAELEELRTSLREHLPDDARTVLDRECATLIAGSRAYIDQSTGGTPMNMEKAMSVSTDLGRMLRGSLQFNVAQVYAVSTARMNCFPEKTEEKIRGHFAAKPAPAPAAEVTDKPDGAAAVPEKERKTVLDPREFTRIMDAAFVVHTCKVSPTVFAGSTADAAREGLNVMERDNRAAFHWLPKQIKSWRDLNAYFEMIRGVSQTHKRQLMRLGETREYLDAAQAARENAFADVQATLRCDYLLEDDSPDVPPVLTSLTVHSLFQEAIDTALASDPYRGHPAENAVRNTAQNALALSRSIMPAGITNCPELEPMANALRLMLKKFELLMEDRLHPQMSVVVSSLKAELEGVFTVLYARLGEPETSGDAPGVLDNGITIANIPLSGLMPRDAVVEWMADAVNKARMRMLDTYKRQGDVTRVIAKHMGKIVERLRAQAPRRLPDNLTLLEAEAFVTSQITGEDLSTLFPGKSDAKVIGSRFKNSVDDELMRLCRTMEAGQIHEVVMRNGKDFTDGVMREDLSVPVRLAKLYTSISWAPIQMLSQAGMHNTSIPSAPDLFFALRDLHLRIHERSAQLPQEGISAKQLQDFNRDIMQLLAPVRAIMKKWSPSVEADIGPLLKDLMERAGVLAADVVARSQTAASATPATSSVAADPSPDAASEISAFHAAQSVLDFLQDLRWGNPENPGQPDDSSPETSS